MLPRHHTPAILAMIGFAVVSTPALAQEPVDRTTVTPLRYPLDKGLWAVTFMPDSKRLMCVTKDYRIAPFDPATGRMGDTFANVFTIKNFISFFGGGKRLLVAGNGVLVFDFPSGEKRCEIAVAVTAAPVVSADERRLYIPTPAGDLIVWDLERDRELARLREDRYPVFSVSESPDGKQIAACRAERLIVYSTETFRQAHSIRLNKAGHLVRWINGGKSLVIVGPGFAPRPSENLDSAAMVWDLEMDELRGSCDLNWRDMTDLVVAPDTKTAFVSSQANSIRVIDLEKVRERATGYERYAATRSIGLSPDGKKLAACNDRHIDIYDIAELLKARVLTTEELFGRPPLEKPRRRGRVPN